MTDASTPDPILEARGVKTVFDSDDGVVEAVRDVDLSLGRGEKLGIVGESGAGKSALALSLLQLIEPPGRIVGGEVRLGGRLISGFSDRQMRSVRGREIALVYQDPMNALDPVKTIGAQIGEAVASHGSRQSRREIRNRCVELLGEVEVPNPEARLGAYPHEFSGGMRQRVVIAIALAHDPAVLLADEPTTALDVTTQAQILQLMQRLVDEHGTAVVLITHNMGVVAEFCDTVNVMYAGRVVERAETKELFARPRHPYSEALLRSVPRPDQLTGGPLPSIPGMPPDLAGLPPGCPFEPRCPRTRGRIECRTESPPRGAVECHFADEASRLPDNRAEMPA